MKSKKRAGSKYAEVDDVEEFAGGLTEVQLLHRTYGHSFNKPHAVDEIEVEGNPAIYYEQSFRCECGAKKYMWLSARCHILRTWIDYSDCPGYLLPKGTGRIVGEARDALRREQIVNRGKRKSKARKGRAA